MKKAILSIVLLFSSLSFGQQYDGLFIEKRKVDDNNKIFTLGREFVYKVNINQNNKSYFLSKNETDSFQISENIDSAKISEIHLTVLKPKFLQRTNKNQTEILYSYEPNPSIISTTGLVENKENIWMHPPRTGFFKSLESCPFPYLRLDRPVGYKWRDSIGIGNHWGNEFWGEWDGRLIIDIEYEIIGNELVQTRLGELQCIVVNSVAHSGIGKSYLKFYFSDKYGFVKLSYRLFNGTKIELNLDEVIDGPILRNARNFLENRYGK